MKLSHTLTRTSAVFDDPNLVSFAGLVPVMALADAAGLRALADKRLTVSTDKGANAGLKVASIVAGMLAGADSIDDMAVLRHGGMSKVFSSAYAPSTLGSFLRAFTFGHVRQLDAVAARFVLALAARTRLLTDSGTQLGIDTAPATGEYALLDVDDTIIEVHGHQKQGAGFGYSKVRGLNAILATLTTAGRAPVIVAQRLRKGVVRVPAGRGPADRRRRQTSPPPARQGPAHPGPDGLGVLRRPRDPCRAGRWRKRVRHGPADCHHQGRDRRHRGQAAWTTIEYTDAIRDETTGTWISRAEVAEIPFTAFAAQQTAHQVPGRLVVRRIPDFNAEKNTAAGQGTLFDVWRFHAFFTTTEPGVLGTVAADQTHRHHAIIEQVHADLKGSALAHLPSGKFTANSAWLVLAVIAFNLTRAAATVTGEPTLAKSTTTTIRRKLIAVPGRVASSARRVTLHLPRDWPWETAWTQLFTLGCGPPAATART